MSSDLARDNQGPETPPRPLMSDEAKAALLKSCEEILRYHQVCGFTFLQNRVRQLGVKKTYLQSKDAADAIAAAHTSFSTPNVELKSFFDEVLRPIHDVYVLKKGPDPNLDPLRDVIIDVLSSSRGNVKHRRNSFQKAIKAKYPSRNDVATRDLDKVLHELCVATIGRYWVLRPVCGKLVHNILYDYSTRDRLRLDDSNFEEEHPFE